MSALSERNGHLKRLKEIQQRANQGIHLHSDYQAMVQILTLLVNRSYERDIQTERAEEIHEQVMSEMDYFDFHD